MIETDSLSGLPIMGASLAAKVVELSVQHTLKLIH